MDPDRYAETPFVRHARSSARTATSPTSPSRSPGRWRCPSNLLRVADAEAALGRLAGTGRLLRAPHLLVHPYLRREAVASTRIEGTQASLVELFDAEAGDQPLGADIEEVVNYVEAMESRPPASRDPSDQRPADPGDACGDPRRRPWTEPAAGRAAHHAELDRPAGRHARDGDLRAAPAG